MSVGFRSSVRLLELGAALEVVDVVTSSSSPDAETVFVELAHDRDVAVTDRSYWRVSRIAL
jgi:hypothetical protein